MKFFKTNNLFRWGPIPGRLINVSHWPEIFHLHSGRLHNYLWPEGYLVFYKDKMLYINEAEALDKAGGKVFREIILTSRLKKIQRVWKQYVNKLFAFCRPLCKKNLAVLSDGELLKQWQEFNKLTYRFWEPGLIPELGAYGGEPILKKYLAREKLSELEKRQALSVLSAPVRMSFYQEEEADLLEVLAKYSTRLFRQMLRQHQKKYYWLENSYFGAKVLDKKFFLKRIKEMRRDRIKPVLAISNIKKRLREAKRAKQGQINRLTNKKMIKRVSDGLGYCIWWQDQRKKYIFRYLHYLFLFRNEFARRLRLPAGLLDFAWVSEISLNPGIKMIAEWRKRKNKRFCVHILKSKSVMMYGLSAKKIFKAFWQEKISASKKEFNGIVVYGAPQPVRAKIFIIKEAADIRKFPSGRILVASMTAPEYISAIRKAKAIVTDTGGITCHAAIVARELKIPCVVGTKVATRVLKDGDIVEVDAAQRIVRKIS